MKVFLRHERTGHYYCGNSEWVTELSDATPFETIEQAQQAINQDKLDGMSLVMIHEESGTQEIFDPSCEVP